MKEQNSQSKCKTRAQRRSNISLSLTSLFVVLLGSTVVLAGCGGGGGNGNGGPGIGGLTPPTLAPAIAGLNSIVRGSQAVTVSNLTTIAGQFDQARQADPTNKDAQLGFAVSTAAIASAQAAALGGGASIPAIRAASANNSGSTLAPAMRTAQLSQALVLWRLPQFLSGGSAASWPRAADFLPTGTLQAHLQPRSVSVTPIQVQTELTALDASLVKVEAALKVVESDPNYSYTLADPAKPKDTSASVKIGVAEIQILSAVISAVRSLANAGLAYNADPGTFDFSTPVPSSVFGGTAVSPAQYLPAAPFLTLAADGGSRMGNVKSELAATALSGIAAIESVKTRSNAGFLLDPGTIVTSNELNQIEAQITSYQTFLTSVQTIPVGTHAGTVEMKVNLAAFLDHPPTDLRVLLPTLAVSNDNSGTTNLTMNGFPDSTFGGIFPDGLPANPTSFKLRAISGGVPAGLKYRDVVSFALTLPS